MTLVNSGKQEVFVSLLPLGTRFHYKEDPVNEYVLIGHNKCCEYLHPSSNKTLQGIYSIEDQEYDTFIVVVDMGA